MLSTIDSFLMDARPRTLTHLRRGLFEFLYFGFKNARACLFVGAFFAAVLLVPRAGLLGVPRYDLLLIAAIAIQLGMLKAGLETWDELKAVCLFHVVGFALEAFKVSGSIQSWSYPDFAYTKIAGVPLFAGFMYASVGSYIRKRAARAIHVTAHLESPMQHELYEEMAALLDSDGMNYTVFLQCYTGRLATGLTIHQSIKAILGPGCVIDEVRDVDAGEVEAIVRDSLAYVGEVYAGPGTATLASPRLRELLDAILADCRRVHDASAVAASFRIVDGHPAYPVFWEFSLFFGGAEEYVVLLGSSSD